ncbi:hypothetical protein EDC04DRAFT_2603262 [Pisolithus marmoratus]|nr:hypothetical protein EDC04DRAFT_2603262 [Pisolithus marmoratus]
MGSVGSALHSASVLVVLMPVTLIHTHTTLAVSSSDQCRNTDWPWEDILDDKDYADSSSAQSHFFITVGAAFLGLSSLLSDSLWGPYNQWKKCDEFFAIALSWPDRDFHISGTYLCGMGIQAQMNESTGGVVWAYLCDSDRLGWVNHWAAYVPVWYGDTGMDEHTCVVLTGMDG